MCADIPPLEVTVTEQDVVEPPLVPIITLLVCPIDPIPKFPPIRAHFDAGGLPSDDIVDSPETNPSCPPIWPPGTVPVENPPGKPTVVPTEALPKEPPFETSGVLVVKKGTLLSSPNGLDENPTCDSPSGLLEADRTKPSGILIESPVVPVKPDDPPPATKCPPRDLSFGLKSSAVQTASRNVAPSTEPPTASLRGHPVAPTQAPDTPPLIPDPVLPLVDPCWKRLERGGVLEQNDCCRCG